MSRSVKAEEHGDKVQTCAEDRQRKYQTKKVGELPVDVVKEDMEMVDRKAGGRRWRQTPEGNG